MRKPRHIRLRLPVTTLLTLLILPLTAHAEHGKAPPFEKWQLWECTQTDKPSSPNERLQFIVTGQATMREISRRPNFQNDKVVISVSLTNLDPMACPHAKRFSHLGFERDALLECHPELIAARPSGVPARELKALRDARGKWLIGMQMNKGVAIGIHPSWLLRVLAGKNCPD